MVGDLPLTGGGLAAQLEKCGYERFLPFITRGAVLSKLSAIITRRPVVFAVGSLNFSRLPTVKIAVFPRAATSIWGRPF